jgi:2-C-methyl-D-erythritol 2,4-cyclodiphosphate synthase
LSGCDTHWVARPEGPVRSRGKNTVSDTASSSVQPSTLQIRVGLGQDTHRLQDGGPLRLGGIVIEWHRHLVGHSDADVLLHAVVDALLGAAGLGDIGEWFPDTDDAHRGRDSATMVSYVWQHLKREGWAVVNLDCVVCAEEPRLGPYKRLIASRIAELVEVTPDKVGVKAKTGEKVGPVGRREAITATCVVLLQRVGARFPQVTRSDSKTAT